MIPHSWRVRSAAPIVRALERLAGASAESPDVEYRTVLVLSPRPAVS